jgi:hypothetical protein
MPYMACTISFDWSVTLPLFSRFVSTSSFYSSILNRLNTGKIVHTHAKNFEHLDLVETGVKLPHEFLEEVIVDLAFGLTSVQKTHDKLSLHQSEVILCFVGDLERFELNLQSGKHLRVLLEQCFVHF